MPVHPGDAFVKPTTAVFEARFGDGFRYLDRCGETVLKIRSYDSQWKVVETVLTKGQMLNYESNLLLTFESEKMIVAPLDWGKTLAKDMRPTVDVLAKHAEMLYTIITSCLEITETVRVGARFAFNAPADTLEEAEAFVLKSNVSEVVSKIADYTKSVPYHVPLTVRLQDDETGYRRAVRITTVTHGKQGDPRPTGLRGDVGGRFV